MIKKTTILFLFCLLSLSSWCYDKTYAVIVAVADYKYMSSSSGDLRYTLNDAKLFADFLMSEKGGSVPSSNIYLLTNEKAKKENILYYTQKMFSKANSNDRVIFYYSGHGDRGVFLPYDVTTSGGNLLYYSEVKELFRYAKCSTKLLIADACFSGSIKETKKNNPAFSKVNTSTSSTNQDNINIAVMISCSENETSLETPTLKQGVFTYYLIKGLKGNADSNYNGNITIKELFYYVYKNTTQFASNVGQSQTPVLFGDFNVNLIVGTNK